MNPALQHAFLQKWRANFGTAELPLGLFYSDAEAYARHLPPPAKRGDAGHCLIGRLADARAGKAVALSKDAIGCPGGARYAGYAAEMGPKFRYFLSCGLPGRMEGERYKKTPEIVDILMREAQAPPASAKYLVVKRWDTLTTDEEPEVVAFFVEPDALAGLFTLANFRSPDPFGVIAPFSAGCGSVIAFPRLEAAREAPRAVIGLFDPSARPHVGPAMLSFAAPWAKFRQMIDDMDESFLITPTWDRIRKRMGTP